MSAIMAPVRTVWSWFKLAIAIGAGVLALVVGWDVSDAEALGGHLWGIVAILWGGLVEIYSTIADNFE